MKNNIILMLLLVGFMISIISAEITVIEQPKDIYNVGDTLSASVKIKTLTDVKGFFQMNLICGRNEINFYRNWISMSPGDEKEVSSSVQLAKELIGDLKGICKIKATIPKDYSFTNEFTISESVKVEAIVNKNNFNPEEEVIITGNATKESGSEFNGFIEIVFSKDSKIKLKQTDIATQNKFSSKIKLPKTMEAGDYSTTITAYEKSSEGIITNRGFVTREIAVPQIPTNLEIFFEQREINPGETLKIKAILHDQTGEKINAFAVISIKDEGNKVLEQVDKQTDSLLEYKIREGTLPGDWKIVAISNQITKEETFRIKEQEKISIDIINETVILTNIGNIPYNEVVFVKIGDEPFSINASLRLGESKKYLLTAPNGEYNVKILSPEGGALERSVALTGEAISVKEISEGAIKLMRHPSSWIFIALILGIAGFLFFKKGGRRTFFGYFAKKAGKPAKVREYIPSQKNLLVSPKNKANLVMALQGNQQSASIVCVKIKNLSEMIDKNSTKDTLRRIVDMAESVKASVYENNECIFFLFAPLITKITQSELTSADFAQTTKKIMDDHNKLFKQKIKYGISAEYGEIVAKKTEDAISFMALGSIMVNARKLASLSSEEVCIGEKLKDKIQSEAKLEKRSTERGSYYVIKEIKDKEKHKTFLSSFVQRYERDRKKSEEPKKEEEKKEKAKEDEGDENFDLDSL